MKLWKKTHIQSKNMLIYLHKNKHNVLYNLNYCVHLQSHEFKKDIFVLEQVQKMMTKLVKGLDSKFSEEQMMELWQFSLKKRSLMDDLIQQLPKSRLQPGGGLLPGNDWQDERIQSVSSCSKGGLGWTLRGISSWKE